LECGEVRVGGVHGLVQPAQFSVICALYKVKLDEEKSKYAGLALQNGFGPEFWYSLLAEVGKTHSLV
jgi:hypothetical protein